ncbi:VOC family protein [Thalassotalea atypica]|uniref:VOC family protein n=1 Tax=Thalassotalea atypica TaxID=2054316 RepID=UPI002572D5C6|nr:VOC family protein [Thalassotalea atypica]
MSDSININDIGQIAIAVSDLNKSCHFYNKVLGLPLLFEAPPHLAFYQVGDVRLMLTTCQGQEREHQNSVIYYRVSDIETTFEQLKALGVTSEQKPQFVADMADHRLWMGFIRDPDETLIGIMAQRPLNTDKVC